MWNKWNRDQPSSIGFLGLVVLPPDELSTLLSEACFLVNLPDMTSLPESMELIRKLCDANAGHLLWEIRQMGA